MGKLSSKQISSVYKNVDGVLRVQWLHSGKYWPHPGKQKEFFDSPVKGPIIYGGAR